MSKKINDGLTKQQRYYLRHKNNPAFKRSRRESQLKWRKDNPDKSKENCRKYYQGNRERELKRAKSKFQRFKNGGYSDRRRLWDRVNCHKRRAATQCENPLTTKEWQQILAESNGCCVLCGVPQDITIDHIIPVTKGGKHTANNVQPLCRKCNSSKGAKCG